MGDNLAAVLGNEDAPLPLIPQLDYLQRLRYQKERRIQRNYREQWSVHKITERHRMVMRLSFQGMNNKEIASALDMTEVAVGLILRSEIVQKEIAGLHQAADSDVVIAHRRLQRLASKAVKVHEEIVDNAELHPSLRQRSADSILDRVGLAKASPSTPDPGPLADAMLDEIERRAFGASKRAGTLVDVTNSADNAGVVSPPDTKAPASNVDPTHGGGSPSLSNTTDVTSSE